MTDKQVSSAAPAQVPLLIKTVPLRSSWCNWKADWNKATSLSQCMGLLHSLFETEIGSQEEEVERIVVCCNLADGHCEHHRESPVPPRVQQQRKAFEVLAHNLFKNPKDKVEYVRRLPPEVLNKLVWFFRPKNTLHSAGEEGRGLHNTYIWLDEEKTAARNLVTDFFIELLKSMWGDRFFRSAQRGEHEPNKQTLQLARTLRPTLLEIVHASRKNMLFDLLWIDTTHLGLPDWARFDDACLMKLKEIALATVPYARRQRVKTIEEAAYFGSSAAQLFLLCSIAQEECKRQ